MTARFPRLRLAVLLLAGLGLLALPIVTMARQELGSRQDHVLADLRADLANDSLSAEDRASLEEKFRITEADREAELDARSNPGTDAEHAAKADKAMADAAALAANRTPVPLPCSPAGDGCLLGQGTFNPPAPSASFNPTNAWSITGPEGTWVVYAGAGGLDASGEGQVMVVLYRKGLAPAVLGRFSPSPTRSRLTITSAEGAVLELLASDGTVSYFDATSRMFLER